MKKVKSIAKWALIILVSLAVIRFVVPPVYHWVFDKKITEHAEEKLEDIDRLAQKYGPGIRDHNGRNIGENYDLEIVLPAKGHRSESVDVKNYATSFPYLKNGLRMFVMRTDGSQDTYVIKGGKVMQEKKGVTEEIPAGSNAFGDSATKVSFELMNDAPTESATVLVKRTYTGD